MKTRKRTDPNRPNWVQQLLLIKAEIAEMADGSQRDAAVRRAEQLSAAIGLDGWLRPINRTGAMDGKKVDMMERNGTRFVVVGDRSVGWSIRAISGCGQAEELVGVYPSRAEADGDLGNAVRAMS